MDVRDDETIPDDDCESIVRIFPNKDDPQTYRIQTITNKTVNSLTNLWENKDKYINCDYFNNTKESPREEQTMSPTYVPFIDEVRIEVGKILDELLEDVTSADDVSQVTETTHNDDYLNLPPPAKKKKTVKKEKDKKSYYNQIMSFIY